MTESSVRYEIWIEPTEEARKIRLKGGRIGGPYSAKSYANWVASRERQNQDVALWNVVIREVE